MKAEEKAENRDEEDVLDFRKYSKYYTEVKKATGFDKVKPIHFEDKTKIDHILRLWDLDYKYGPCTGMTRLERWERANEFGLDPPSEVRNILLTRQAKEQEDLRENVFYGQV